MIQNLTYESLKAEGGGLKPEKSILQKLIFKKTVNLRRKGFKEYTAM